ncbi:TnsA endonuclease N-terminal domain-containing protein [Thalassomonas sp. M1454]|uniref:TnsA endonuclease N-terminal domain-containing protein n=1 Tax=Thalassomonas sp. M1454 TaxID=2594477 RepID=UPI00117F8CA3|nr:TnsA endonuclease N-terminal domain-containing protein [Thalassomonas sp. M1454]TRX55163.1 hypothetical protein FNN08_11275 [Thalassomonas sp. M1454]
MIKVARKISKTSRTCSRPNPYTHKGKKRIKLESQLEMDGMMHLELNKDVVSFKEQPFSFMYEFDGKQRRYTPDFLVKYRSGQYESQEIKPSYEAINPKFIAKFARLSEVFNQIIGHPLKLMTSDEIRKGHTISNLRNLYRFIQMPFSESLVSTGLATFKEGELVSLDDAISMMSMCEMPQRNVMQLIAHSHFQFDKSVLLQGSTPLVWVGE